MAHVILVALFPLITLILMGFLLKKSGFVPDGFWTGVEKVNYYILFPAMLFMTLAHATIELNVITHMMQAVMMVMVIASMMLYSLKYIYKTPVARFGVYMQSMIRFNTYIGLALVATLLKQQGMAIFAIMLAVCIPLVNVLSVIAMTQPENMNLWGVLKSLIKNPMIVGCMVGGAFNALNLPLWIGLESFLKQIGACSLPLGLLTVGAALKLDGFKTAIMPLISNVLGRLLLMPLMALGICNWINLATLQTQVLVLFFALPTASASYILTKVLKGDSEMMASIISLQTLFALFTLPFIIYLII